MTKQRTIAVIAMLAVLGVVVTLALGTFNQAAADDNHTWSVTLGQSTHLAADQFEEALCLPNSAEGQAGNPPPKLMGWDSVAHTWVISLTHDSILRANPGCPQTSYIASQIDSISPLSQTLNDRLFQQGSYRVMYPGRVASWQGVSVGPGFFQPGAIGAFNIGWQSGEPDVLNSDGSIDFSQYKVQIAAFGIARTADPGSALGLDGGNINTGADTPRVHAFVIDYRQGTFWEELNSQYDPGFFQHPHNYAIAWVDTSQFPLVHNGCNHPFEIVFLIDGQVVAIYTNGTTSQSPFVLSQLQGAPQTGLDQRLNAQRCTNPEPTQLFAGMSNPDAGNLTVPNGPIPLVPLTMTIGTMSISSYTGR